MTEVAPPRADAVRVALIGDVVGKPGMRIACAAVPWLRHQLSIDCLIINGENIAEGSGIRCKDYRRLIEAGYHVVTLGDHAYRKREIIEVLESEENIILGCNLPEAAPGRRHAVVQVGETSIAVISALGRVFMKPIDCPFRAVDNELNRIEPEVRVRILDFHAEATSDKQMMGRYMDGRMSAVLGTHTHVATADEQILPGGTAFQCDVGMTGPFDGILGREAEAVIEATLHSIPLTFKVASGDVRLNGTWVDVDRQSGHAIRIGRIAVDEATIDGYQRQLAAQRKIL